LPVLVEIENTGDFESEHVTAFELGYRLAPARSISLDLAGFLNFYDNLRSTTLGIPVPVLDPLTPYVSQPATLTNDMDGKGYGVEVAAEWRTTDWWHLLAAYTYLQLDLQGEGAFGEMEAKRFEGLTPKHAISLRSQMALSRDVELDLWLRYVDDLPGPDDPKVTDYLTLDAHLGWRPTASLELSLVGQNLLDARHLESVSETGSGLVSSEVERSVYGKITWEF
jgi:iron complex outermembrane receptor protein